jgi:hypothetical protein
MVGCYSKLKSTHKPAGRQRPGADTVNARPLRYVLDEYHHAVEGPSLVAWGQWLEDPVNRVVGWTLIVNSEVEVLTTFIGLDLAPRGRRGPPVLFETMISGGPLDGRYWRYSSWDDAETGHKVAVRKIRKTIGSPRIIVDYCNPGSLPAQPAVRR